MEGAALCIEMIKKTREVSAGVSCTQACCDMRGRGLIVDSGEKIPTLGFQLVESLKAIITNAIYRTELCTSE